MDLQTMPRRPAAPPAHVRQWFAKQGQKGGKASANALTPEERSAKASRAVQARWAKARGEQPLQPDRQDVKQLPPETAPNCLTAPITIPDDLLERLDALQARMSLPSRQSALEIALRAGLANLQG